MLYQDLGSIHNMTKLAYGAEGHSKLTGATGQGLRAGPSAQRILTEYAADVADAQGGSGRLADAARGMRERGGLMNRIGARLAETGSSIGTALDKPIMSPYSPAAQSRHAFPGTLEQAAERIRTGRASAGSLLAEAAMAEGPARNRGLVQALAQAGESAHIAQDIKPHTVVAGDFARQAGEGAYGKRMQLSSKAVEKLPQSLRPMAVSGVGHAASGLEGGAAALDDAALITGREMRGAEKHGKKIRLAAIENLRYGHNIPTQEAVGMVDQLLGLNPGMVDEIVGKGAHRAGSYKEGAKSIGSGAKGLLRRLVLRK